MSREQWECHALQLRASATLSLGGTVFIINSIVNIIVIRMHRRVYEFVNPKAQAVAHEHSEGAT